jgi:hypothetical protein
MQCGQRDAVAHTGKTSEIAIKYFDKTNGVFGAQAVRVPIEHD